MKSLFTLTTLFYFTTIKIKYLTMLTTVFLLSLLLKWNLWLCSLRCFYSLTTLTTLFYFTTIKWKSVTMLTMLFYFHYYQNEISLYGHCTIFLHWLYSLRCVSWLLLKWNLWLCSVCCFSSLTTLTTLFYFTAIKWKSLTTLITLFYFYYY